MGFYIDAPVLKGKADFILANVQGAQEVPNPFSFASKGKDMVPVVVVDNGPFEAAAVCYSRNEMDEFCDPFDKRRKRYLLVPRRAIIELCPRVENRLEEF